MSGLRFGTIVEQDPDGNRARVKLDDSDGMITWWLGVLGFGTGSDSVYIMPDIGEHVAVLLDQRGEDGVILGARHSTQDRPQIKDPKTRHILFRDGTELIYDRELHHLTARIPGEGQIHLKVGRSEIIMTDRDLKIKTPDLEWIKA